MDLDVHAHQRDVDGLQPADRVGSDRNGLALRHPTAQREFEGPSARGEQHDGRMTHRARRHDPGAREEEPAPPEPVDLVLRDLGEHAVGRQARQRRLRSTPALAAPSYQHDDAACRSGTTNAYKPARGGRA